MVSVSLRSIIHSYSNRTLTNIYIYFKFPSPYGVLFILILGELIYIGKDWDCFRLLTEYHSFLWLQGFSDIICRVNGFRLLTEYHSFLYTLNAILVQHLMSGKVSVSLRSIIHSYFQKSLIIGQHHQNVSVSLRSIIHSYTSTNYIIIIIINYGFRLLTEYHSFLLVRKFYKRNK